MINNENFQEVGKVERFVQNTSDLIPLFVSDNILVLRAEEAFSFGSLVADCGGVLGLFVGFNFLMVWGLMWKSALFVINKVNQKQIE